MHCGIILAAMVGGAMIALWPSLASLFGVWRDIHDYQYGFPIAAIAAAWIVIVARRVASARPEPAWAGTILLAGALLAWLVAFNANSLIAHQVMVPVVVWLAILAGTGWPIARQMIAPVAFLYFAIPVWDYAVPLLQRMSVATTETALGLAGVPAVVREHLVTIPEGAFRIVEGCSGKRYFMVTLAVACLAAAVNHIRGMRAVAYVAICGGLALVANWLRIFIVIYAGHATNMQHYLVAVEHKTFGNAIFVLLLVAVFLLARRLGPAAGTETSGTGSSHADAGFTVGASRWRFAVPATLLASTIALVQARSMSTFDSPVLGLLPLAADVWQGPMPANSEWMPGFVAPADERRAAYRNPAGSVELYVNLYGEQQQGAELIYYGNTLLAPGSWSRAWPPEVRRMPSASGPALADFEARGPDGSLWVLAYGYQVGGWYTTLEPLAQLSYGLQSMLKATPSGMVALASRCDTNCEAARALVKSFWDELSTPVLAMRPRSVTGQIGERQRESQQQAGSE